MRTGRHSGFSVHNRVRLFAGDTATDILGAIVHRTPDWGRLPETTPLTGAGPPVAAASSSATATSAICSPVATVSASPVGSKSSLAVTRPP